MYDRFAKKQDGLLQPPDSIASAPYGYFRLQGTPKMFCSEYSRTDLMRLHEDVIDRQLFEHVFIYFNNTASAAGILNALEQ